MSPVVRSRSLRHRIPRGLLGPRPLPFVGADPHSKVWTRASIAVVTAFFVHGLLSLFGVSEGHTSARAPKPAITQNVTLEKAPAPPPLAEASPKPPPPRARRSTAPPSAAMGGKVVARAPSSSDMLDLTQFDVAVGKGDFYAGGFTTSAGTSTTAVSNPKASATGTGSPDSSLARPAAPSRQDWACAWPEEEEQRSNVRDVRVTVQVHVDRDGMPQAVDVLNETSPAFAQAARRCALAETYRTARDDEGRSIAGITPPFIVHFLR